MVKLATMLQVAVKPSLTIMMDSNLLKSHISIAK